MQTATHDVLVLGGGNAALCAALTAREAGRSVMLVECAPRHFRGGNSRHTRNLRCMHDGPTDVLTEAYSEEECWEDVLKVTGGETDERLARLAIRHTDTCRGWMPKHGVRFQPSMSGTLHLSRANAFFLGGGKALVNAYYHAAETLGIAIAYETEAIDVPPPLKLVAITPTGEFCICCSGFTCPDGSCVPDFDKCQVQPPALKKP